MVTPVSPWGSAPDVLGLRVPLPVSTAVEDADASLGLEICCPPDPARIRPARPCAVRGEAGTGDGAVSGTEPPRPGADGAAPRRLVPFYALTGGRTRPGGRDLPMESLVTATDRARGGRDLQSEYRTIVELARRPVSLVEIGAVLAVPMTVARVLVSDLVEGGYLEVHAPPSAFVGGRPSAAVLARLLDGLRAR